MKKTAFTLLAALLAIPGSAAFAGGPSPVHVVELFTSQGCSSCPVSNALLTDVSDDPGVLGLTYSVEYWDYLGWKDTFASPSFSGRQRAYSAAIGHGRVYTPQIVVNGAFDKPRFTKAEISDIEIDNLGLQISRAANDAISLGRSDIDNATVRLVTYVPGTQSVPVKRGENGGRILKVTNVVTDVIKLGVYDGSPITFDDVFGSAQQTDEDMAYAVIVQSGDYGPIISAANFVP